MIVPRLLFWLFRVHAQKRPPFVSCAHCGTQLGFLWNEHRCAGGMYRGC